MFFTLWYSVELLLLRHTQHTAFVLLESLHAQHSQKLNKLIFVISIVCVCVWLEEKERGRGDTCLAAAIEAVTIASAGTGRECKKRQSEITFP